MLKAQQLSVTLGGRRIINPVDLALGRGERGRGRQGGRRVGRLAGRGIEGCQD